MNVPIMTKRIEWIDALRGWLMLLVIWTHTTAVTNPPSYFLTAGYMGEFFLLTGYTMQENYFKEGFYIFLKKKAQKFLVPYAAWGGFLIIFYFLRQFLKGTLNRKVIRLAITGFLYNAYTMDKLKNEVFLICDNNTFWFITVMFVAQIIVFIYINFINTSMQRIERIRKRFIAVCILIFMVVILNCNSRYMMPWGIDTAFVAAALILIGRNYRLFTQSLNSWFDHKTVKLVTIIVCFLVYMGLIIVNPGINMSVKEYGPYGTASIAFFIIIAVTGNHLWMELFKILPIGNVVMKGLVWIGRHTIPYMMLQICVIRRFNKVTMHFTSNRYLVGYTAFVGTIFVIAIICILFDKTRESR